MEKIIVRDARIFWQNFAGSRQRFNDEGRRNFCIELEEGMALRLKDEGWNIKENEYNGDISYYTKVNVRFDSKWPPKVFLLQEPNGDGTYRKRVQLTEESVKELDDVMLTGNKVELTPNPKKDENGRVIMGSDGKPLGYNYPFLNRMYCTIKYSDFDSDVYNPDYDEDEYELHFN